MQLSDKDNISTPANWENGMAVVTPSPKNYAELKEKIKQNENSNCMDWFLCFKKPNNITN